MDERFYGAMLKMLSEQAYPMYSNVRMLMVYEEAFFLDKIANRDTGGCDITLYSDGGIYEMGDVKRALLLSVLFTEDHRDFRFYTGYSSEYDIIVDISYNKIFKTFSGLSVMGERADVERYKEEVIKKLKLVEDYTFMPIKVYFYQKDELKSVIAQVEAPETYSPLFYPWVDKDLIFDGYLKSKSPIIVINGKPGTGKSVLAKLILKEIRKRSHNPTFIHAKDARVIDSDEFWCDVIREAPDAIVFDDFDSFLESRKNGNILMSKLLSFSDGVVSVLSKTKIIITTNYDNIKQDPAFLRPGRLYDYITLEPLDLKQTNKILQHYKINKKDFSKAIDRLNMKGKTHLTVAEIFECIDFINSPSFTKNVRKNYNSHLKRNFTKGIGFEEKDE